MKESDKQRSRVTRGDQSRSKEREQARTDKEVSKPWQTTPAHSGRGEAKRLLRAASAFFFVRRRAAHVARCRSFTPGPRRPSQPFRPVRANQRGFCWPTVSDPHERGRRAHSSAAGSYTVARRACFVRNGKVHLSLAGAQDRQRHPEGATRRLRNVRVNVMAAQIAGFAARQTPRDAARKRKPARRRGARADRADVQRKADGN